MTVRNLQAFRYRKTVSTSSMFVAVITVQTLKILSASIRHSCPCRRAFRFGPCLSLAARRRLLAKAMSPCSHRKATALCFQESADCGGRQLMGPLRRSDFSSHAANRVHPNSHQTDRNWHLFRIAAIIHSSAFIPMIQHPFCISPQRPQAWALWTADTTTGEGRQLWKSPFTLRGSPSSTEGGVNLHWAAAGRIVFLTYLDGWPHLYSISESGGEPMLLTPGNYM